MDDAQKIALIASFLLRYPDESWYNELGECREHKALLSQQGDFNNERCSENRSYCVSSSTLS